MIIFLVFIAAYCWSIWKIKKACGSWSRFNSLEAGFGAALIFTSGTSILAYLFTYFLINAIVLIAFP